MPLSSGICRSTSATSGFTSARQASASRPLVLKMTSNPSWRANRSTIAEDRRIVVHDEQAQRLAGHKSLRTPAGSVPSPGISSARLVSRPARPSEMNVSTRSARRAPAVTSLSSSS